MFFVMVPIFNPIRVSGVYTPYHTLREFVVWPNTHGSTASTSASMTKDFKWYPAPKSRYYIFRSLLQVTSATSTDTASNHIWTSPH